MSIWGDIRKKSLGQEKRIEDIQPEVHHVQTDTGVMSTNQLKNKIMGWAERYNYFADRYNDINTRILHQIGGPIYNDDINRAVLYQKIPQMSKNAIGASIGTLSHPDLMNFASSIHSQMANMERMCVEKEKQYNRMFPYERLG